MRPAIIDSYLDGSMLHALQERRLLERGPEPPQKKRTAVKGRKARRR
ncbi:hypothetical protein [Herbaspirillum sp. ST 5-3]|nr:hypothetical protein [Herbaspirillum sp. ST 5-3]